MEQTFEECLPVPGNHIVLEGKRHESFQRDGLYQR